MGLTVRNGERETFHKFFECWLLEQSQHLDELISVSKQPRNGETHPSEIIPLVGGVIQHYEKYYLAKAHWAGKDIMEMFSPSWTSSLEDALFWIGGWRPSMAFHLLYSKIGSQTEAALEEIMHGLRNVDLGDLSHTQLVQVDKLMRETIRVERDISEKMAKHQETVADSSMVELSHEISEMITEEDDERVESALVSKEEGFKDLLRMADDLRLKTLKGLVDILSPIQAVHFLIAAAELHLRLHEWGKKRDARKANYQQSGCNGIHHQQP